MVTKYDVFEVVYKNKNSIKPIEVVRRLNKTENDYNNIHRLLTELEKDGFLARTDLGFQIKKTEKTRLLYDLIYYCLKNEVNYNLLLDKKLAMFINRVLSKKEIKLKAIKINPRTFSKYIQILNKYGLLLIISKKPLKVKMFYNFLVNNLLIYFGFKPAIRKETISYLNEIEKELKIYKNLRKKNEVGFRKIVEEFEISFVNHSLALEGNPITLPDTIKILKNKIIPANLRIEDVDEVKNYQLAILQMLRDSQQGNKLNEQSILNYHKLAMQHRPEIAGKIREIKVYIKGNPNFKIVNVDEIKPKLNSLFEDYNKFIKKKKSSLSEILSFASFFHNEFQHIHPFIDGNSRTARLITFHLLQSKSIPILDIPLGLLDEYLSYTKGARKRNDKKLSENLQKIILFNLKKINEKLAL